MPREASKCRGWEKERRDRLKKSFDELAKVLPSYVPSINLSKIEILKQAHTTIIELKEEINILTSSKEENKTLKDAQIRKLQERVKKLLIRNEQLTNMFKDAGIKPPKVVGLAKTFKKQFPWRNKSRQDAKILHKKETEKENVLFISSQIKSNKTKLHSTNQAKCSNNNRTKIQGKKKFDKKVPVMNSLLVFSQIPTVPTINQQLVLVSNARLNNVSKGPAESTATLSKPNKVVKAASTLSSVNLGSSSLGPGTLILGNGNIISLLPQPQIMIPPITLPSQTVVFSKVIKGIKATDVEIKKNAFIRPKQCITKTTQINKVPIPAFTSKYANTSLLLNNPGMTAKRTRSKKTTTTCRKEIVKNKKRKTAKEDNKQCKRNKTEDNDDFKKKSDKNSNEAVVNSESQKSKMINKETAESEKSLIRSSDKNSVNESDKKECPITTQEKSNSNFNIVESTVEVKESNKVSSSNDLKKIEPVSTLSSMLTNDNEIAEKSIESNSLNKTTYSNEQEIFNKTYKPNAEISTSENTTSIPCTSSVVSISAHEESIKNIDLNLVHSDLSNDIFATLQVPPGCQNTESTSPTAAFLLAFPLVSSIKVTEVIDEENSNSQRETPTLLQIGSLDNSKPNHNDSLLNLDNFPFFNSKDMCSSYYNSKVETSSNNITLGNNKNPVTRSIDGPSQDNKLENGNFNMFTENNKHTKDILPSTNNFKVTYEMFPKSEDHILENKTDLTKPEQKLDVIENSSNHMRGMVNNEQYVLYEEKSKENGSTIFQQSESGNLKLKNFHALGNDSSQITPNEIVNRKVSGNSYMDKLQNTCSILSNINTNYNLSQENTVRPTVSTLNNCSLSNNILYKNYKDFNEKDLQINTRKDLDTKENTSNQIQYIFKNSSKDISNNGFSTDPKLTLNLQKQFVNKEQNLNVPCNNFVNTAKLSEISQNLENFNKTNKASDTYPYNPFDIPRTSKDTNLNLIDNCNKPPDNHKDRQTMKPSENLKRLDGVCPKSTDTKTPCYFSSNYSTTSVAPSYKPDFSKSCPPCTYENQRNYSNPFYTNCNYTYNYSDTNINQNYYKSDAKSCYSLNYENYQEYRKTDTSFCNSINFTRDRKNSTSKDKPTTQNKPVNWMTEQRSQASDCFLPSFTNQSYSFTSCISIDNDISNVADIKKTTDLTEKRFSWSPTKLPNFLEPTHNFITAPTLPTLVGDLALGNSLPVNDVKSDYKYSKESKRKTTYDNQANNFLSVSQLVNQTKSDNVPARAMTRRLNGNKTKSLATTKTKRFDKNVEKNSVKPVNNFDIFYDQKSRNTNKNLLSNYSAEALIGNQTNQETKKCSDNSTKSLCSSNFLPENIVPYFNTVDDGYMNQNQNFHNTFQNNSYPGNSFIYTTPSISSGYLSGNFESSHDYATESMINYCGLKDNKNCNNKNYRTNKEEKNIHYLNTPKKTKKNNPANNNGLGNFEYPLLPIQGSTSSPVLPDDFQSHTTFLPPTTLYTCKNSLYQKQNNDFNPAPLLPLPGITKTSIQQPQVSPSLNVAGTSLTNFNLSTIFPEINKGNIPNVHSDSNKNKNNSGYLEGHFSTDSKYGFSG